MVCEISTPLLAFCPEMTQAARGFRTIQILFLLLLLSSCNSALPMKKATEQHFGKEILPDIMLLTGADLKEFQTSLSVPELADPYVTQLKDSVLISGTAQYHLKFKSIDDIRRGGPYQVVWNDFYYPDGTKMEGERYFASSWDMKPALWSGSSHGEFSLWDPATNPQQPTVVWYGGRMRPQMGERTSRWPDGNFSRDVFAFVENIGKWRSLDHSIFTSRENWPRPQGNFLGHRYGHQMVMIPKMDSGGIIRRVPVVFFEEVTEVHANGSPAVTRIFMDEMVNPYQAKGTPVELISPYDSTTGRFYPSGVREDGSALVEGPLYFRFTLEGEEWEAIGFSSGSFYGYYPSCFASRRVSDGFQGKPFQIDLADDGSDFHNAGGELGRILNLTGGPGRPAVIIQPDGLAIPGPNGMLQVLVHGYRRDLLETNRKRYRVVIHALLRVRKGLPAKGLRFDIQTPPPGTKPNW